MADTEYKMEDSEKEAFELIRGQPNYVWSAGLFEFALAYSGFDPFASIEAYRNRTSGWKLRLTKCWLRLSIYSATYMSVKTLTIFCIRWFLVGLDRKQHEHRMSGPEWLLWFLGDPYSIPPLSSLTMYILFPLGVLWLKICMPIYMEEVEHFDCTIARFILEPEEEIRQFDLQASQLLKDTCEAVEHQRWILSRNFRFEQRLREDFELFFAKQSEIHWQLDMMREVIRQIHLVRPKALRPEWHQLNYRLAFILSVLTIIGNITIVGALVIHLDSVAWNGHCAQLSSLTTTKYSGDNSDCSLLEAFSFSDLFVMLELHLSFLALAQVPGAAVATYIILQTTHQLFYTSNVAGELRELLAELRTWNCSQQVKVKGGSISDLLTRKLCTNMVGIWMFERESRKSVSALGHGTRMSIAYCLSHTALSLASVRIQAMLDGQKSLNEVHTSAASDIQKSVTIMFAFWRVLVLQSGAVQIACAAIPARISHVDKLVYSLVAELIRTQQAGRTANDLERLRAHDCCFPMDDPITSLWRRQMRSRKSAADRASVCSFGTKLTYQRAMKTQFYYATITSIIYSYIK